MTIRFRESSDIKSYVMEDITILRLDENTLDGASELENLCFSSPWSRDSLGILLRDGAVGFCAVDKTGRVLAYGGMLTVLDEGEITNIACHPDARRGGLGKAVTSALLDYGKENGILRFSLEVRESNFAAISLYEKLGFSIVGRRKGFYEKPREDAFVMIKNIED